jgi:hypothetical protein
VKNVLSSRGIAGLAGLLVAGALGFTAVSTADASTGTGGSFVAVTPQRIADTSTDGSGFSTDGHFGGGESKTVQVTNRAGVPTLANVSAVVIDVAGASSRDTRLYVDPSDETRRLASLSINGADGWDSTTVIVRPGSDGKIKIFNEAGATRVNIDIQGYFTKSSTAASAGGFVSTTPARVIDSSNGKGLTSKVSGGAAKLIKLAGVDGVPSGATGVFAHVRVLNSNDSGGARFTAGDETIGQNTPSLVNYESGRPFDGSGIIPLDSNGRAKLWGSTGTTFDIAIDVHGYFTAGTGGGSFHPVNNDRIYDSASSPSGNLAPGETREVKVGGRVNIPDSENLGSVALSVTALDWTSSGYISVVNADLVDDNDTSNLAYTGTYSSTTTALTSSAVVEMSNTNSVKIRNRSASSVRILLNAQGWFDTPQSPEEAFAGPTSGLIATSGVAMNDSGPIANAEVLVDAWPNDDYVAGLAEGAEVPVWPVGTVTADANGKWQISVQSSDIPSQFKGADGTVHLQGKVSNGTAAMPYSVSEVPVIPARPAGWRVTRSNFSSGNTTVSDANDSTAPDPVDPNEPTEEGPDTGDTYEESDPGTASNASVTRDAESLPPGVVPMTPQLQSAFDQSVSVGRADAEALIAQQQAGDSPATTPENSSSDVAQASPASLSKLPRDSCFYYAEEWKNNQKEKFGSIYNWSGAKVTWTQTSSSRHTMGIAFRGSTGTSNWKAQGDKSLTKGGSVTATQNGVINKTAYNRVNYRRFLDTCAGEYWKPQSWGAFFSDFSGSVKKTWNKACINYNNFDLRKDKARSYTKSDGVSLAGIIDLSAQSGYDKGTSTLYKIRKPTTVCGTSSSGINNSRGIRAFAR